MISAAKSMSGNILIVDDESMMLDLLKSVMEKTHYNCAYASNGEEAAGLLEKMNFDVLVTDIDMPKMSGVELAKLTKAHFQTDVIIMTGQTHDYHYDEMIQIGASDFVEKPFSPREMILRIDRVIRERRLKQSAYEAHEELKSSYLDSIHRLVMAAEFKDEDTGDHIVRIGEYCAFLAEKMNLNDTFRENMYYAAPMHDIGKIGIPDKILLKPGKLTTEEFDEIKKHTLIGAKLLSNSKSKILQLACEIALNHHERFNGKGYPNQLKAEDIPISGRIVALADTFDALTSKRPYKDPYPADVAYDIMKKDRGEQFDPEIFDLFTAHFDQFVAIRLSLTDPDAPVDKHFKISERDRA